MGDDTAVSTPKLLVLANGGLRKLCMSSGVFRSKNIKLGTLTSLGDEEGIENAPFDHCDLHAIVHAEARDHGVNKDRDRLPPGQGFETRQPYERKDCTHERIRHEG